MLCDVDLLQRWKLVYASGKGFVMLPGGLVLLLHSEFEFISWCYWCLNGAVRTVTNTLAFYSSLSSLNLNWHFLELCSPNVVRKMRLRLQSYGVQKNILTTKHAYNYAARESDSN